LVRDLLLRMARRIRSSSISMLVRICPRTDV
jgi:hypothetical protein